MPIAPTSAPASFTVRSARIPWDLVTLANSRWVVRIAVAVLAMALVASFARAAGSLRLDFQTYYDAGWNVRNQAPLYTDAFSWRDAGYTVELPGQKPTEGSPYVYPPAFALAFVPLTLLPADAAGLLWFVLTFASVVGAAWLLARLLFQTRLEHQLLLALAFANLLAIFQPARMSLVSAQVDTVLLFVMTLALGAFARRSDGRAGLWLALGVAIKPTLGFLVLFFLWKRAYKATLVFGTISAALLVLPALVLGPAVVLDFLGAANYWSSPSFAVTPLNQAPYGLLLRILTPNGFTVPLFDAPLVAQVLRWAIVAAVLVGLTLSVGRNRPDSVRRVALEYGLFVIGLLLASPLSEDIHFTYLGIPLIALAASLASARRRSISLWASWGMLAAIFLYLSLPALRVIDMAFWSFYSAPVQGIRVLLTGMHLYALLALTALTLAVLFRGDYGAVHVSRFPSALARLFARRSLLIAGATAAAIGVLAAILIRAVASPLGDFGAYYNGASAVLHGDRLYAMAIAWRDAGFAVKQPVSNPLEGSPYAYPPALAVLLAPLAALPFRDLSIAWLLLSFCALLVSAYIAIGISTSLRLTHHLAATAVVGALLALFQPARSILFTGQIDLLLLLLLTLALRDFTHRNDTRVGLWLAAAIIIKPTVGVFLLFFVWKRAYRAIIVCAAAGAALLILPFLVVGIGTAGDYLAVVQYWSSATFGVSPVNQSPYGLFLRMFTPNAFTTPLVDAPVLASVLRLAVIVTTGYVLTRTLGRSRAVPAGQLGLEYGLAVVAMLFTSPLSEDNHYVYVVLAFLGLGVATVRSWSRSPRAAIAFALVLFGTYAFLSLPSLNAMDNAFYAYYSAPVQGLRVLLTGMHVYGLSLLLIGLVAAVHWQRRLWSDVDGGRRAVPARSAAPGRWQTGQVGLTAGQ